MQLAPPQVPPPPVPPPVPPQACKWAAWYAKCSAAAGGGGGDSDTSELPWDTKRPSSQLVATLCTCIEQLPHERQLAAQLAAGVGGGALEAAAALADAAPVVLPPGPGDGGGDGAAPAPHWCGRCAPLKPPAGADALEIGCGTGAAAAWLAAACGFRVTAADVVPAALDAARRAAAAAGCGPGNPRFVAVDVLDWPAGFGGGGGSGGGGSGGGGSGGGDGAAAAGAPPPASFDLIYDCQVYHALVRDSPRAAGELPARLFALLRPGGLLLSLTGNANEPEVGPAVLGAAQLLGPLLQAGFRVLLMRPTRFDSTRHYDQVLRKRPLAWWALLQRPPADGGW